MNCRHLNHRSIDTQYTLISSSGSVYTFGYYIRGNSFFAVDNIIIDDLFTIHKKVCCDLLRSKPLEVRDAIMNLNKVQIIIYLISKFIYVC